MHERLDLGTDALKRVFGRGADVDEAGHPFSVGQT